MTPKTVPLWGNASPGQGNLLPKMKVGPRKAAEEARPLAFPRPVVLQWQKWLCPAHC